MCYAPPRCAGKHPFNRFGFSHSPARESIFIAARYDPLHFQLIDAPIRSLNARPLFGADGATGVRGTSVVLVLFGVLLELPGGDVP